MSFNSALHLNLRLTPTVPDDVKNILAGLVEGIAEQFENVPDHPFFRTSGWANLLTNENALFPFPAHSILDRDLNGVLTLFAQTVVDDSLLVDRFLDWIGDYVVPGIRDRDQAVVGYIHNERHEQPKFLTVRSRNENLDYVISEESSPKDKLSYPIVSMYLSAQVW